MSKCGIRCHLRLGGYFHLLTQMFCVDFHGLLTHFSCLCSKFPVQFGRLKANACIIRFPMRKESVCMCTVCGLVPAYVPQHLRLEAVNQTKRYSQSALTEGNDLSLKVKAFPKLNCLLCSLNKAVVHLEKLWALTSEKALTRDKWSVTAIRRKTLLTFDMGLPT